MTQAESSLLVECQEDNRSIGTGGRSTKLRTLTRGFRAAGLVLLVGTGFCATLSASEVRAELIALEGQVLAGSGGDPVAVLKAPFTNELGDLFVAGSLMAGGTQDGFIWAEPDQLAFLGSSLPSGATVSSRGAAANSGEWLIRTYSQGTHEMRSAYGALLEVNGTVAGSEGTVYRAKQIAPPTMTADGVGFFRTQLEDLTNGGLRWGVVRVEDGGAGALDVEVEPNDPIHGYPQVWPGVTGFGTSQNGVHRALSVQLDDQGVMRSSLAINGQVVAMTGDPTGRRNETWNSFGSISLHADGSYLGTAGVKVGSSIADALAYRSGNVLAVEPIVALTEGDCAGTTGSSTPCVMLADDGGFKSAALDPTTLGGDRALAYVWVNPLSGPEPGAEYLLYACDAEQADSSYLMLRRGDEVDLDGDGVGDALVDRVGIPGQAEIAFTETMLYLGVELSIDQNLHAAIIGLSKPDCQDQPGAGS